MVAAVATHASATIASLPRPAYTVLRPVEMPVRADWIELEAAQVALRSATVRTVALIRSISDPTLPVTGSHLTLGDAAAHLVLTAPRSPSTASPGFPAPSMTWDPSVTSTPAFSRSSRSAARSNCPRSCRTPSISFSSPR